MGEGKYQEEMGLADNAGSEDAESYWPSPLNQPPGYWLTGEKRVVAIRNMTDAHLTNAISYLDKCGYGLHPKALELTAERDSRKTGE